jgi:uncharacterized membrane protein
MPGVFILVRMILLYTFLDTFHYATNSSHLPLKTYFGSFIAYMFIVIILLGIFGIIALAILSIFPDLINSLSINISPVYYYMDDGYQKTVSEIIRVQNKLEYLTTTCLYGQYHSYMYAIQDNYPQSHINYHHEWFQRTITDIAHEKRYLKTLIDKLNTRV